MGHWIATFWYFISYYEYYYQKNNDSWIFQINLVDQNWQICYLESFYWAIATIMLIGSKGITPLETIYTTFTLLWTVCVFAYLISKISMIIEELHKGKQEYKQDLEIMNRYMESKTLDKELQSKVRSFLEYIYKASGEMNVNKAALNVLDKFPIGLRNQICQQINEVILNKFKFFQDNFTRRAQNLLISAMQEQCCITNEYLFQQGDNKEPALFLIIQGTVELNYIRDKQEFHLSTLKPGQIIGDLNIINGQTFEYSAKCQTFVNLCRINRKNLLQIVKQDTRDLQIFQAICEKINFSRENKYYPSNCQICKSYIHKIENCNLLVYRPDKLNLILKDNYKFRLQDQRQIIKRSQKIRKNKALDYNLQMVLIEIQEELNNDEEFQIYQKQLITEESYYSDSSVSSQSSDIESCITQNKQNSQIANNNIQKSNSFKNLEQSKSQIQKIKQEDGNLKQTSKKLSLDSQMLQSTEKEHNNSKEFEYKTKITGQNQLKLQRNASQHKSYIQHKKQKNSEMGIEYPQILDKISQNEKKSQIYKNSFVKKSNFFQKIISKNEINQPRNKIKYEDAMNNLAIGLLNNLVSNQNQDVYQKQATDFKTLQSRQSMQLQKLKEVEQNKNKEKFFYQFESVYNYQLYLPYHNLLNQVKQYKLWVNKQNKKKKDQVNVQQFISSHCEAQKALKILKNKTTLNKK